MARIVLFTRHLYAPDVRRTRFHFVADALADAGHDILWCSVGHSRLQALKPAGKRKTAHHLARNRFEQLRPHLRGGVLFTTAHPISTSVAPLAWLLKYYFRAYGRQLPRAMAEEMKAADFFVFETGLPIVFMAAASRTNPKAKTVYWCGDDLANIGAPLELQRIERDVARRADVIIATATKLLENFADIAGAQAYVPQGIDKPVFDEVTSSPYPPGTINAVSVGDMLFDFDAARALADASPDITFHYFGLGRWDDPPANVVLHGERAFAETVPYIKFADIAMALYRKADNLEYLLQSSLKLVQYRYCELPVIAPDVLTEENVAPYRPGEENDWKAVIAAARQAKGLDGLSRSVPDWSEVSTIMLSAIAQGAGTAATARVE